MGDEHFNSWGGEVRLPHWLRRLRHKPAPSDTPEKLRESHKGRVQPPPDRSVMENLDQVVWGGFRDLPK
jgi:hypothetical protein